MVTYIHRIMCPKSVSTVIFLSGNVKRGLVLKMRYFLNYMSECVEAVASDESFFILKLELKISKVIMTILKYLNKTVSNLHLTLSERGSTLDVRI